jgi:hypothetical protein
MRWPSSSSSTEGARELCIRQHVIIVMIIVIIIIIGGGQPGGRNITVCMVIIVIIIITVTMCRQYNGRVEWPPNKQTEERANGLPNQQSFSLTGTKYAPEQNYVTR